RITEDCGQQQRPVFGLGPVLQVGEVAAEADVLDPNLTPEVVKERVLSPRFRNRQFAGLLLEQAFLAGDPQTAGGAISYDCTAGSNDLR
ncbi:hypothetical protein SMA75_26340, partial [Escherichia coli]